MEAPPLGHEANPANDGAAAAPGPTRRRHHRRAKKKKAARNLEAQAQPQLPPPPPPPQEESSGSLPPVQHQPDEQQQQPANKKSFKNKRRCRKRRSGGQARAQAPKNGGLVLRPSRGPAAPQNSTQYIIEDHVNDVDSNPDDDDDPNCSDDDKVWEEFSERDFQNVYESAHREEVAEMSPNQLISGIKGYRRKQDELMKQLQRHEPNVFLEHLMAKANSVMEKNRVLQIQHEQLAAAAAAAASTSPDVTSTALLDNEDNNVASSSCDGGGGFSPPVQT